jgi:hypothetical protein
MQVTQDASLACGSFKLRLIDELQHCDPTAKRWPDAACSNLFELPWFFGTKNTSGNAFVNELNATTEGSQSRNAS